MGYSCFIIKECLTLLRVVNASGQILWYMYYFVAYVVILQGHEIGWHISWA